MLFLPAAQYAENIQSGAHVTCADAHTSQIQAADVEHGCNSLPKDASPEQLAFQFIDATFEREEHVLRAAKMMAAKDLAANYAVREYLMALYWSHTAITTKPTEAVRVSVPHA